MVDHKLAIPIVAEEVKIAISEKQMLAVMTMEIEIINK
jgi:hypothetical protein